MGDFTAFEEENILLLALDNPDFFYRIMTFIKSVHFDQPELQYILTVISDYYTEHEEVPTREIIKNIIFHQLETDNELATPIIDILNKELDTRNTPWIKKFVMDWAKKKQIGLLYNPEVMEKAKNGDLDEIQEILEGVTKISDTIIKPFKIFDEIDYLFTKESGEHFTTGIPRMDTEIWDGKGPRAGEVIVAVAPTGVGKSIYLINAAVANMNRGKKVLHISLENDVKVTGHRYLGAFTRCPIKTKDLHREEITDKMKKFKATSGGELYILYFIAETVTVDTIHLAIKELNKFHNFKPDMIVLDYLECLLSKNPYRNKEEYGRQKAVSTEFRSLVSLHTAFGATASQTNRSGVSSKEGELINLDKLSESYGKSMPQDYIFSLNQTMGEYQNKCSNSEEKEKLDDSTIGRLRAFMAKNRNGKKHFVINMEIDYSTMVMDEVSG